MNQTTCLVAGLSANTSTASDKKVVPIEASTPSSPNSITGNRIIDMDILSSIVDMLACQSSKSVNMESIRNLFKENRTCLFFIF